MTAAVIPSLDAPQQVLGGSILEFNLWKVYNNCALHIVTTIVLCILSAIFVVLAEENGDVHEMDAVVMSSGSEVVDTMVIDESKPLSNKPCIIIGLENVLSGGVVMTKSKLDCK